MTHVTCRVGLLAEDGPHNSGPDFGKASPFGLLVVVLLLIAVVFLVRSMNRHLKKLPESFDPQHPEPDQAVDDGTIDNRRMHPADRRRVTSSPGPPVPTFASTPTTRCIGGSGRRPRWPRPRNAMCRSCFRSATPPATGVT